MVEFETIIHSFPIYIFYDKKSDLYYLVIRTYAMEYNLFITREEARDISKLIEMR